MKKNRFPLYFMVLIGIGFLFITACENENDVVFDTFNTDSKTRNLIVVISDYNVPQS